MRQHAEHPAPPPAPTPEDTAGPTPGALEGPSSTPPRHLVLHGAFGNDRFGILAERFARFFGTPRFIIGQTALVVVWIGLNAAAVGLRWDPYPFILLNLAFSTQAAYAAPLILLAATRQAERDKVRDVALRDHHEAETRGQHRFEVRQLEMLERERALAEQHATLLAQNTQLTEQIARLTAELHAAICGPQPVARPG
jgi:uncharacterized membrane protein